MQPILYLLQCPEYWAGVGTVIFFALAGAVVFLVFADDVPHASTPNPEWLHTSAELSRAAAARKAKADARRWGKRGHPDGPRSHGKPQ